MHRVRRKCWNTNGYIFGTIRRGVAYPFAGFCDDGLSLADLHDPFCMLHTEHARKHQRVFSKLRRLPRLHPTWRTRHPRDGNDVIARVHAPDEFLDPLGLRARGGNNGRHFNQRRQEFTYLKAAIEDGSPTRMKNLANACEKCSRYGD